MPSPFAMMEARVRYVRDTLALPGYEWDDQIRAALIAAGNIHGAVRTMRALILPPTEQADDSFLRH